MNRVRTLMGLITCSSMLLCLVGCPQPQVSKPQATAPPPTIVSKVDVEKLKREYAIRLRPNRPAEVIGDKGNMELVLVGFREQPDQAFRVLHDLKRDLRFMIESKGGRIETREIPDGFTLHYESHKVKGEVHCHLTPHNNQREHWEIHLNVKEHPR